MKKNLFWLPAVLLIGMFCLSPAYAHIEKGSMPDVVAEMEYRILLDFQPEKNDVRNNLGMVLYRRNKLQEAENEFRTVLKNDPKNFDATDALGLVYMKMNEFAKAEKLFKDALAIKSDDVLVYFHLGEIYVATGRYAEAQQSFTTALALAHKAKAAGSTIPDLIPINQALQDVMKHIPSTPGDPAAN